MKIKSKEVFCRVLSNIQAVCNSILKNNFIFGAQIKFKSLKNSTCN